MHENWGKSFFCPMDKNIISSYIEWCIEEMFWFVHSFLQN